MKKISSLVLMTISVISMLMFSGCQKNVAAGEAGTIVIPDDSTFAAEQVVLTYSSITERVDRNVYSQLLLTVENGTTYKTVDQLVKSESGKIIGYISFSGDYQIEFKDGKTNEELNTIISTWSQLDYVENVSLNYVYESAASSVDYSQDPWKNTSTDAKENQIINWSDVPGGNEWWAEAIGMQKIWEMNIWSDLSGDPIKIGVIDNCFDLSNKDLKDVIVKTWSNNFDHKSLKEDPAHGTHVSGLIAAKMGNNVGIAGVAGCIEPELYCFSVRGDSNNTYHSVMDWKYAVATLLSENVKIINRSMALNQEITYAAEKGVEKAIAEIKSANEQLDSFLMKAIDSGYDFLIVDAAGNMGGYVVESCEVNEKHPYGYEYMGLGNGEPCNAALDYFTGIENSLISDHIISVGAVKLSKDESRKYEVASFSNYGCDVYAPGENILSTVRGKAETGFNSGTSMAAPIVTGIAALIWQANTDLSATQVKDILIASYTQNKEKGLNTIDAPTAVNMALKLKENAEASEDSANDPVIMGYIYELTEKENETTPVVNAKVTIVSHTTQQIIETFYSGDDGTFELFLPADMYSLSVEADGYVDHVISFEVEEDDVDYLSIQLSAEGLKTKRLIGIKEDNGSYTFDHSISYNKEGLPVKYYIDPTSDGGVATQTTISYNKNNKISKIQTTQTGRDGFSYSWEDIYQYDDNNRFVGYKGDYSNNYVYDDSGNLISFGADLPEAAGGGTSTTTLEYNSGGQLIEKTTIANWGTRVIKYSYDFYPFVVETEYYNGSQNSHELGYLDQYLDAIVYGLYLEANSKFEFEDGYVVRVSGEDYTYEFVYENIE